MRTRALMVAAGAALVLALAGEAAAQQRLKGMELVGHLWGSAHTAIERCGGGKIHADLSALANIRDVDFRYGMAIALGDLNEAFARDVAATCADLRAKYGPGGTVAPGAWVTPGR